MNSLLGNSRLFLKKNASTILTCIGGAGVVTTTVLAVKATPKAVKLLEKAEVEKNEKLTTLEKVKVAGPAYIPTVVSGIATIACIFGANILNKRQQASLMSAYALLENSYKEYKDKVIDLYGEEADKEVRAGIVKDKYEEGVYPLEGNKQLYYDEYSQRYFEATSEQILRAETYINKIMTDTAGAYVNEFYDALKDAGVDIDTTDYGDYMGWSSCELYDMAWSSWLEFYHEKVIMDDGLEVTIIRFGMDPMFDFENYY